MKICIGCAGRLVELRSQGKTFCPSCTEFKDWPLDDGEVSLTGDRIGGISSESAPVTKREHSVTQTQHTDGAG